MVGGEAALFRWNKRPPTQESFPYRALAIGLSDKDICRRSRDTDQLRGSSPRSK